MLGNEYGKTLPFLCWHLRAGGAAGPKLFLPPPPPEATSDHAASYSLPADDDDDELVDNFARPLHHVSSHIVAVDNSLGSGGYGLQPLYARDSDPELRRYSTAMAQPY